MKKMLRILSLLLVAVLMLMPAATMADDGVEEPAAIEQSLNEQPAAEEPAGETPAAEAPAVEEPKAEEPAAEEPAAEVPAAEEPKAEEPAEEAPAAEDPVAEDNSELDNEPAEEPAAEEPAAEEPAEEEPVAEEPVAEEPVSEEPAEEPAAEEPAGEEPAEEIAFTGKVHIVVENKDKLELGGVAKLRASVKDANMGYKLSWQKKTVENDGSVVWLEIGAGERLELAITEDAILNGEYRVELTAEDGTVLTDDYHLPKELLQPEEPAAEEPVEEPAAEEPAVEEPVAEEEPAEEPANEEPAAEEPAAEEPVAEEPAAEEPVAEEPVAEEPAEEPVTEEPAEEEEAPAEEEEPSEEEPAAEAPAKETKTEYHKVVSDDDKTEEPAAEEEAPAEEEPEKIVFNFGGTPAEEEPEEDETQTITLEGTDDEEFQDVNVREGAEVTVVSIDGDWVTVIVDGQQGYIYKDDIAAYLDLEEDNSEFSIPNSELEKKVTIFTSRRTVMEEGEPVYLTSKLEGFEDCEAILDSWYVDKGNGFEEVEGANADTYEFEATAESLSWGWKLDVLYR